MLNNFNQMQEEEGYEGDFMAMVVFNQDPLKLHRFKVSIVGLLESDDIDALPWVLPKTATTFGNDQVSNNSSLQSYNIEVPAVGSRVYVYFQNGDPHFPVYEGRSVVDSSLIDNPTYVSPTDHLMVNYPARYGWRDQAKNVFYSDATPGQQIVEFIHHSSAHIRFDDDGTVTIGGVSDLGTIVILPSGTINITSAIDINIVAANHIQLTAPRIDLN